MKKSLKSKIILAGLTIGVVAATVAASTYSWFIERNNAAENGATAEITAAWFDLEKEVEEEALVPKELNLVNDYYAEDELSLSGISVKNRAPDELTTVEEAYGYTIDDKLIFPGEGLAYTLPAEAAIQLINNREVVVAVDVSSVTDLIDVYEENANVYYYNSLGLIESVVYDEENSVYYFYVPAGDDEVAKSIIGDITVAYGLIDTADNEYMNTVEEIANSIDAIGVTAVQATPAAVADVFEGAITLAFDEDGVATITIND